MSFNKNVKIRALGRFVFIKPLPQAETTAGGIYIPEAHRPRVREGIVASVGCGLKLDSGSVVPTGLEVGQRVCFTPYAEADLKSFRVGDEDFLIVDFREVQAVLVEATPTS